MSECPTDSREEIFLHTIVKELRAVTVKLSASEAMCKKMAEALRHLEDAAIQSIKLNMPLRSDWLEGVCKQALTAYEQEK